VKLKANRVLIDKNTEDRNTTIQFKKHDELIPLGKNNNIYEALKYFILGHIRLISLRLKNKIKNIHYLPASRSGLYQALNAFSPIIAELSKNRRFINKKIELPSLSEPLSDYFLELSTINISDKLIDNKITRIASEMENTILNGKIEFDNHTKKLMFAPNNTNLKLDLSYTSSMVSELSPIVSYLRYIVNYSDNNEDTAKEAKPLIIIEEPEAHLHPDIQIKLLKLFAELAKSDIKFIITTHSNYIFNKFNNLIISKDIDTNKSSASLFKETPLGSDVTDMELDEFGMEDENFIYTSESLYNEKMQLIKDMNS
jgi:predicted ATPase